LRSRGVHPQKDHGLCPDRGNSSSLDDKGDWNTKVMVVVKWLADSLIEPMAGSILISASRL
jgi:hypothetical protein